jgi:hypothetical protein
MEIIKQYGQDVYEFHDGVQGKLLDVSKMDLMENNEGQVSIYICKKRKKKKRFFW